MNRLASMPLWIIELFGTAKSFRDNPILGSRLLNRLGLHVGRMVIAHAITNFRWWVLSPLVTRDQRRQFRSHGFVAIENYLPADEFAGLEHELRHLRHDGVRECHQGDTLTLQVLLDDATLAEMPATRALVGGKGYQRLLMYCGARLKRPLCFIHCVKNHFAPGATDPQKHVHADTFHPTMKSWLFIDAVDDTNGPFTYVPGSQRLTWSRLKWEYAQSIAGPRLENSYSARGSLRATEDDLAAMNLPQPVAFKVPANTLVIANTHGFHCRGEATAKSRRLAIYASSRTNPFNPLPGFASKLWSRIEHLYMHRQWHNDDERSARQGRLSSWHLVPGEKLHEQP